MESRTKFMGHPVHQQLIVFPLGLFVTSLLFDIAYLISGKGFFPVVAYYNIFVGLIGGLTAAIFGFRDWLAIPAGTRARRIGAWHGLGNLMVTALFFISWLVRQDDPGFVPSGIALALSFLAVGTATITGWLGGELVDRLGVGVDRGANLDAPSSLSGVSAHPLDSSYAAVPVTGEKYQEKHIEKTLNNELNEDLPAHHEDLDDGDVLRHSD